MKKSKILTLSVAAILSSSFLFSCGSSESSDSAYLSFGSPSLVTLEEGTVTEGNGVTSETRSEGPTTHYTLQISFTNMNDDEVTYDISKLSLKVGESSYNAVTFFRQSLSKSDADTTQSTYTVVETYTNSRADLTTVSVKKGLRESVGYYVEFNVTSAPESFEITYDGNAVVKQDESLKDNDASYQIGETNTFMYYYAKGFKTYETGVKNVTYANINLKNVTKTYYIVKVDVSLNGASSTTLNISDFGFTLDSNKVSGNSFISYRTEVSSSISGGVNCNITTTSVTSKPTTYSLTSGEISTLYMDVNYSSAATSISITYKNKAISSVVSL